MLMMRSDLLFLSDEEVLKSLDAYKKDKDLIVRGGGDQLVCTNLYEKPNAHGFRLYLSLRIDQHMKEICWAQN